jgi:hypothetical protein
VYCRLYLRSDQDIGLQVNVGAGFVWICLDFSKAFDSVDQELLFAKLATQYGFTTCAVGVIRSYLSNRMQYVFANGRSSSFLPLTTLPLQLHYLTKYYM